MSNLKLDSPRCIISEDNIPKNIIHIDKKKEFDLSTNASNKLMPNLSNPTNLTNPLIIASPKKSIKVDSYGNNILSNKEYKINKLNAYNKLIFNLSTNKIHTSKSELNLLNKGIIGPSIKINNNNKILNPINSKRSLKNSNSRNSIFFLNYEPKSICSSKKNINYNELFKKNSDFQEYKNLLPNNLNRNKDKDITKNKNGDIEINSIWEKLHNSKSLNPIEKNVRVDITKFIKKYEYIDTKKQINLIQYDMKIKNDRYNKIRKFNSNEINTLDNVMNSLGKSSDYIQKNYQENYVSNVLNLSRQVEKEKIINNNLLIDKNLLLRQISKIENKLSKINEEKNNILKWIYLQIKVKERKIKIPAYYRDIIENKVSLDSLIKKYKMKDNILNEKEYKKIKEYKEKLIFKDLDELYEIYESLEKKIFYDLNRKLNNINNIKKLKNDLIIYSKIDKENINNKDKNNNKDEQNNIKEEIPFEEKEKEFVKLLKKLKFKNNELNEEYSKISHYRYLLDNEKRISFYNSIKYENNKNDNGGTKLSLFGLAMNLYDEEVKANFTEIPNKIKWKYSLKEEKIILDILDYSEKLVNYLYDERKYYYSDEKLKNQYKLVADEIEKETKNKKLLKQLELQEQLLVERKEKIQMRLNNRNYFKPYRKVDFQHYLREKNKSKNKHIGKEEKDDNFLQYFFY